MKTGVKRVLSSKQIRHLKKTVMKSKVSCFYNKENVNFDQFFNSLGLQLSQYSSYIFMEVLKPQIYETVTRKCEKTEKKNGKASMQRGKVVLVKLFGTPINVPLNDIEKNRMVFN